MKKNIALVITSLAGLGLAPAFAQSNVTLYGIVDTGLTRIDSTVGGSSNQLRSGNLYTSRFGFRGREDLGGGLRAIINLEGGLNTDTGGTSSPFFNRQSWVGLSSDQWGQVTLGRMFSSIADVFIPSLSVSYLGNTTAAINGSAVGAGSSAARFNNMIGGTRVDNALKYQSASMHGLKAHAMVAMGEVSGSSSAGRMQSFGGSYNSDSFEGGVVYHERKCTEATGCGPGKANDKILGLGGSYKLKGVRYGMTYTTQKNALNVRGNDADVIDLFVRVPIGQWVAAGGLQFLNDKTALNQDVRQLNLGATYSLSKRTSLYGLYSMQSVKNGGKAGMYSVTSAKDKQNQLSVGIAHNF